MTESTEGPTSTPPPTVEAGPEPAPEAENLTPAAETSSLNPASPNVLTESAAVPDVEAGENLDQPENPDKTDDETSDNADSPEKELTPEELADQEELETIADDLDLDNEKKQQLKTILKKMLEKEIKPEEAREQIKALIPDSNMAETHLQAAGAEAIQRIIEQSGQTNLTPKQAAELLKKKNKALWKKIKSILLQLFAVVAFAGEKADRSMEQLKQEQGIQ